MLSTRPLGFEHERKALVLLVTSFYILFFAFVALAAYQNEEPAWGRCFLAMALCYGIGFFSLASGWFWGRWYTIGIGYSGLTTAIWGMVTTKQVIPVLVIYGITHGLMALLLQGDRMIALFDGRAEWKQKLGLDEEAAERIKKTVIRAVSGLPTFILFALAPRGDSDALHAPSVLLFIFVGVGLYGILKGRTLGLFALCTGILLSVFSLSTAHSIVYPWFIGPKTFDEGIPVFHFSWLLIAAAIALAFSIAPFVKPVFSRIRHRHAW